MAPKTSSANTIQKDAEGQYAKGLERSDNNGVSSAKPRVITGSDDATANRTQPGKKPPEKDWDVNSDERDIKDDEFRG
ncbi:hypothetical protein [Pararhizobium sp. O133]|uniref:hypothetical protein n=1 Tax=Pararhizobium sp. O133 TaxID=3449278 RepID=UPI003F687377